MILDHLENADIYRRLSQRFAAGFDYLRKTDFTGLADGRYELIDGEVYAMIQTYQSKPPDQGKWEAHRRHADIQYVISGREQMGIALRSRMQPETEYNCDGDVEFFQGTGEFVIVEQGTFAVFLPQDVHMPMLAVDHPRPVKKVVVKVLL